MEKVEKEFVFEEEGKTVSQTSSQLAQRDQREGEVSGERGPQSKREKQNLTFSLIRIIYWKLGVARACFLPEEDYMIQTMRRETSKLQCASNVAVAHTVFGIKKRSEKSVK
jgi:hypothetical protein